MSALEHAIDEFEQFLKAAKVRKRKQSKWTKIPDEPCSFCRKLAIYHIGADCYMCVNCGRGFGSSGL